MKQKILKCQTFLFNAVNHEIFQKIEIFISEVTTRLDKKHKATHKKKWEILCREQQNTCSSQKSTNSTAKLVVNLSSEQLSPVQIDVLSRGLNFAVVPEKVPTLEIIKSIEASTFRLEPEKLALFKAQIRHSIERHKIHEKNLTVEESEALEDLKLNKNIVIAKADKGNVVVVQNKENYEKKMATLVSSEDYEKLKSDPTKSIENKVVAVLKKSGEFDNIKRRQLTPQYSKAPHIYGLVKIHKANYPIRPIVSSIGSPCQKLAKYVVQLLNPLVGNTPTFIKNSEQFIESFSDQCSR